MPCSSAFLWDSADGEKVRKKKTQALKPEPYTLNPINPYPYSLNTLNPEPKPPEPQTLNPKP